MQPEPVNGHTKAGTAGGTLLVLLLNIGTAEVLNAAILAAVGAAVSFTVSLLLRWLLKRLTRK